jgi:hypothetical protein
MVDRQADQAEWARGGRWGQTTRLAAPGEVPPVCPHAAARLPRWLLPVQVRGDVPQRQRPLGRRSPHQVRRHRHQQLRLRPGRHPPLRPPDPPAQRRPWQDLVIYELMIDDFTAEYRQGRAPIDAVLDKLDYLAGQDFNATEFLPWVAWPDEEPYSWGYDPASPRRPAPASFARSKTSAQAVPPGSHSEAGDDRPHWSMAKASRPAQRGRGCTRCSRPPRAARRPPLTPSWTSTKAAAGSRRPTGPGPGRARRARSGPAG